MNAARRTPCSAGGSLAKLLDGGGRVDFPTVTDLCERIQGDSTQMLGVAKVLAQSLDSGGRIIQLKALTIAHELLYDSDARQALLFEPGLVRALESIRGAKEDCPAEETVQLLTSEILRRLEPETICEL